MGQAKDSQELEEGTGPGLGQAKDSKSSEKVRAKGGAGQGLQELPRALKSSEKVRAKGGTGQGLPRARRR